MRQRLPAQRQGALVDAVLRVEPGLLFRHALELAAQGPLTVAQLLRQFFLAPVVQGLELLRRQPLLLLRTQQEALLLVEKVCTLAVALVAGRQA